MSHIKKQQRNYIDNSPIGNCGSLSPDEVSYAIVQIVKQNLEGKSPSEFNAYLGSISRADKEVHRLFVVPHEEQMKYENGEI